MKINTQLIKHLLKKYTSQMDLSHLALQSVRFLGRLHLHVVSQRGVLMQGQPVVLIADQRLGHFSVGDLQHVHGQVELGELLR